VKRRHAPVLATERLVLRPSRGSDREAMARGLNDAGVARMLARVPWPYTLADADRFLAMAAAEDARHNFTRIIERDGRAIGCISLGEMPRVVELGYWLARDSWGVGLATEAARALIAHAFDALGLRLVRSGVFADNAASLRVQVKLGFRPVGRSLRRSLARGSLVAHIDTVLTPARFRQAGP
jgi:RimJ/RimL family protein N-acetyltransferase